MSLHQHEQTRWRVTLFTEQVGVSYWRVAKDTQTIEHAGRYSHPAWILRSASDAQSLADNLNTLELSRGAAVETLRVIAEGRTSNGQRTAQRYLDELAKQGREA